MRWRIDTACQLLRTNPALSVEAIGKRVGFSHGNYFARIFRRTFGVTPSAWRVKDEASGIALRGGHGVNFAMLQVVEPNNLLAFSLKA